MCYASSTAVDSDILSAEPMCHCGWFCAQCVHLVCAQGRAWTSCLASASRDHMGPPCRNCRTINQLVVASSCPWYLSPVQRCQFAFLSESDFRRRFWLSVFLLSISVPWHRSSLRLLNSVVDSVAQAMGLMRADSLRISDQLPLLSCTTHCTWHAGTGGHVFTCFALSFASALIVGEFVNQLVRACSRASCVHAACSFVTDVALIQPQITAVALG